MHTACEPNLSMTTNQDYGSFYSGRGQSGRIRPSALAWELAVNDQVRHERRQLPSIAYDIMFDVCLVFARESRTGIVFIHSETQFVPVSERQSAGVSHCQCFRIVARERRKHQVGVHPRRTGSLFNRSID